MRQQVAPEFFERFWDAQFPGLLASGVAVAEPLESNTFELEGHQLVAVEVGDSDTYDTTVLHVPDLGLVVAGDVAYNDIHPFLVESTHTRRLGWIAALDKIESLKPRAVIAGHKRQGRADNPTIIEETRQYLRDFDRVVDATTTPQELYEQMLELYPDRLNPGVLWSSAQALKSDASPLWSAVRSLDG